MVILQIKTPSGKRLLNSNTFPVDWKKTCEYRFVLYNPQGFPNSADAFRSCSELTCDPLYMLSPRSPDFVAEAKRRLY